MCLFVHMYVFSSEPNMHAYVLYVYRYVLIHMFLALNCLRGHVSIIVCTRGLVFLMHISVSCARVCGCIYLSIESKTYPCSCMTA